VSPVTGSFLPLAGRVIGSLAVHLNRSNQSSNMLHKTLVGLISFRKYLSYLCRKSLEALRSNMSSSLCFVDSVPSFKALSRLSWSLSLQVYTQLRRLVIA